MPGCHFSHGQGQGRNSIFPLQRPLWIVSSLHTAVIVKVCRKGVLDGILPIAPALFIRGCYKWFEMSLGKLGVIRQIDLQFRASVTGPSAGSPPSLLSFANRFDTTLCPLLAPFHCPPSAVCISLTRRCQDLYTPVYCHFTKLSRPSPAATSIAPPGSDTLPSPWSALHASGRQFLISFRSTAWFLCHPPCASCRQLREKNLCPVGFRLSLSRAVSCALSA